MLSFSCTSCNEWLVYFGKKFNKINAINPNQMGLRHGTPLAQRAC
jgi:hypothetical protein